MKKLNTLLVLLLAVITGNAQIVNIPDANFKLKLLSAGPNNTVAQDANFNYITIDNNSDGEIQVTEASLVSNLRISNANISDLTGIASFSNLHGLFFRDNQVGNADLSSMVSLQRIDCSFNQLTSLNVSGLYNLLSLVCRNNNLQSIDVSGLINLTFLDCVYNQLQSLNLAGASNLEELSCSGNQLTILDVSAFSNLQNLYCFYNNLQTLNVSGLSSLSILSCDQNQLTALNLNGLVNLQHFGCSDNQINNLDLSSLTNLRQFGCADNLLTTLDLTGLSLLQYLNCSNNLLQGLNVDGFEHLLELHCFNNQIAVLDVNSLTQLQRLDCHENQLQTIDINGLNLQSLICNNNMLTSLTITGAAQITNMDCSNNQLTTLDFNEFYLNSLNCSNNLLTSLYLKNGANESPFDFSGNPSLAYICADEGQIPSIQIGITANGYTNCHVNSYCSFTPGGTFYTIQGNNRYDENNNGCDLTDNNFPNLKLSFSNGTNTGNLISDASGTYHYEVQYGTHNIIPILENPSYFNVSPNSATVNFPNQQSPFEQDFCISPNGTHNDLEIELLPLNAVRPGFDAEYKIIYKNKGTHGQSGSVNLVFNDAILDLVYSNPIVNGQSMDNLNWNFNNLLPFETREILVTLNINSPMENPAVNAGDILNYTTSITAATDETPNDNSSTLNQTVVNSFDPNDKTCLEGTTITPSMVGQYVHYIIRFENTGTFPAENIVVKDIIDLNKFDVSSIIPLSGIHQFVTRIVNTNQLEFIFENINLPFDDANNDGYVAFKIKTKPTLVVGDTFSNSANIYFDYNFPIVTNTAITTIQALGNQDFEFNSMFTLSPVPTKDLLTITTKQDVQMSSVNIYNTHGQLVQVSTNPSETIDVSGLQSGSYFIRITSDKGSASGKFVKE